MAAKPLRLKFVIVLLASGLAQMTMAFGPAQAQTLIGGQAGGSVQINPQALDQLGPSTYGSYGGTFGSAPLLGSSGQASFPSISGRPPLPGEAPAPKPLIGETSAQRAAAARPRPARSSTATRPASVRTEQPVPSAVPAPAPAVSEPPPSQPVSPAPTPVVPATEQPAASVPTPAEQPAATPVTPPVPLVPAPQSSASSAQESASQPDQSSAAAQPQAPTSQAPTSQAPTSQAPASQAPVSPAPAPTPVQPPAVQAPANQQSAMVTPPPVPAAPSGSQSGIVTVTFPGGQSELPTTDLSSLDALAQHYANTDDRLQIRAYADGGNADGGSGARRLALSRALAVRAYLIDKGIRSTRIDVRALGTPTDGSPADRVEVAPVGR